MNSELIDVVVTGREEQADGVAVFELSRKDGDLLPAFEAGAHVDVHVSPEIIRQYSLSNAPGHGTSYRLGILKDPASRGGSIAIHENFNVGHELQISEPRNHFPLNMSGESSILVGGGIGVTPMLTMAYALKAEGKSFEFHYCCRSRSSAGFLAELQSEFAEQLHLHFDDEGDEQRFNPEQVFGAYAEGKHVYVCGPTGFMDWVISTAEETCSYPKDNVHFEYFNAEVDNHGSAFEVVAEQSGVTVMVEDGQSITEALATVGIKVDVSCEQGVCGTCLCDVLEGTPDHKDHFLTDEEKEDNDQIVVCCSRSKTDRLVLDI
ncbi:PDR/VanB family oxidoreductase [Neptuniibacter sp.]|uniref:PDR/VanB family oxidoreductase n=1 Tax=Neptuniibacter sp. TaxID=1962643 RepID=UPI002604EEA4|nr:PDR/VanB family oxidoreductase [Neptuniibacter sp.]MCP4597401.1 oxidoreductase [Neptuniibacter sp.]